MMPAEASATAAIACTGASMSDDSRHAESPHSSEWRPSPAMKRRRVAVVVAITAEMILVEFQPRIPGPDFRHLGALLLGAVEGILVDWALDTLTRRLGKAKPGLVLLTLCGAIILGIAHLFLPESLTCLF